MAQSNADPLASYRPDMDAKSHERTYDAFAHFTAVGTVFVTCIVVGLAVGGVKHAWISAIAMIVLAHVATVIGLVSKGVSWRAPAVVLAGLLLMLLLY